MADSSSALAAMLMAQQPKRTIDPADRSRAYAARLMQEGSSTAPVQSVGEGIARALQGALGGFVAGRQDIADRERQQKTVQGLLGYANAGTDAERQAAMENLKDADPGIVAAIASQQIGLNQAQRQAQQNAASFGQAYGATPSGAPAAQPGIGGGQPTPLTIDITPDKAAFIQAMTPHALQVSQQTGLDPRLVLAQTAHETGWGKSAPGNNYFGIKGPGQVQATTEAGPNGAIIPTQDSFRTYADPGQSAADYAKLMMTDRYAPVRQAQGLQAQIDAIAKAGYATDPNYASKLGAVAKSLPPMLPDGTPITDQPNGGFAPATTAAQPVAGAPAPAVPAPEAGSATSGPPPVPKPKPTPEMIQRYQQIIATPGSGMTADKAAVEIEKELNAQWQTDKQIALETWKDQQQSKRQNEKSAIDIGQHYATNAINNYTTKTKPAAEGAAQSIANTHEARALLDAGAFTGTGAEAALALAKLKQAAGLPPDAKVANTQALGSILANQVIAGMGGSLGQGVSNADVTFMKQAKAGEITWTEDQLRKLFDVNEREARRRIAAHDAEASRILKFKGMDAPGIADSFQLSTPAPTYEEWRKQNIPEASAAAVTPPPAAANTGRIRKFNPATGRIE